MSAYPTYAYRLSHKLAVVKGFLEITLKRSVYFALRNIINVSLLESPALTLRPHAIGPEVIQHSL